MLDSCYNKKFFNKNRIDHLCDTIERNHHEIEQSKNQAADKKKTKTLLVYRGVIKELTKDLESFVIWQIKNISDMIYILLMITIYVYIIFTIHMVSMIIMLILQRSESVGYETNSVRTYRQKNLQEDNSRSIQRCRIRSTRIS